MADDMPGKLGYDRTIVVFSPDGRLFQVEYAKETVKLGPTAVGIVYKGGVALGATKNRTSLSPDRDGEKVQEIDSHIGATFAGLTADGRILMERARVKAQIHKITYDEPIDVPTLVRHVGDLKQLHTQYGGIRPLGISFLIGGYDSSPLLFETDPGGSVFEWNAQAIGRGTEVARKVLEDEWKEGLSRQDTMGLLSRSLKKAEKKIETTNVEIATIDSKGFYRFNEAEREEVIKL